MVHLPSEHHCSLVVLGLAVLALVLALLVAAVSTEALAQAAFEAETQVASFQMVAPVLFGMASWGMHMTLTMVDMTVAA